jgi:hypothetical protein
LPRKKGTKNIKVRDLEPREDVKGGFVPNAPAGQQVSEGDIRQLLLIGLKPPSK